MTAKQLTTISGLIIAGSGLYMLILWGSIPYSASALIAGLGLLIGGLIITFLDQIIWILVKIGLIEDDEDSE